MNDSAVTTISLQIDSSDGLRSRKPPKRFVSDTKSKIHNATEDFKDRYIRMENVLLLRKILIYIFVAAFLITGIFVLLSRESEGVSFVTLSGKNIDGFRHECKTEEDNAELYMAWKVSKTSCNGTKCIDFDHLNSYMKSMLIKFGDKTNYICTTMINTQVHLPCHCIITLKNDTLLSIQSYKIVDTSRNNVRFKYKDPLWNGEEDTVHSEVVPESIHAKIRSGLLGEERWDLRVFQLSDTLTFFRAIKNL